jgi:hypothetical protein
MRKFKALVLILYLIILLFLAYLAYQFWETDLISVLTLITIWFAGVPHLNRFINWLSYENTELQTSNEEIERIVNEKLEQTQKKEAEHKNEKKVLFGRLLSEIRRNQKLLKPLSDCVASVLENKDRLSEEIKLLNELKFNTYIYSESSDKFGLLNDESRELIDNYYPELSDIENEFEKLDMIHGASHEYLGYLLVWNVPGHLDYDDSVLGGTEIESFLRHTKKVYDLGEELIKSLKYK